MEQNNVLTLDDFKGPLTKPVIKGSFPVYNLRAIDKYAKDNNKKPADLTDEELEQFFIRWD